MSYIPRPSTSLSGNEILAHVCTADDCEPDKAASNIALAIRNRDLPITFDAKHRPSLSERHPLSRFKHTDRAIPHETQPNWRDYLLPQTEVRAADGMIRFGSKTPWQVFEAKRDDVLHLWPIASNSIKQKIVDERGSNVVQPRRRGRPATEARNLILAEAKRRIDGNRDFPTTLKEFANELYSWFEVKHRDKDPIAARTIETLVRNMWNSRPQE